MVDRRADEASVFESCREVAGKCKGVVMKVGGVLWLLGCGRCDSQPDS